MAYLKILFIQHLKNVVNYLDREKESDVLRTTEGFLPQDTIDHFLDTAKLHNKEGGVQAIHIIQSWSEQESKNHGAEFFQSIGKDMASEYFQGHDFVVTTHTDTGKTHNHILVCPWNATTGLKVTNKKIHLYKLRELSNKLCLERGLSIINQKNKQREAYLPEIARNIIKYNGRSYLLDLMQKIDFAKGISTSREEFDSVLDVFGIQTRITNKHITYFYPGKQQGKRGNKLGNKYDLIGLDQMFKTNRQNIADHPQLQTLLQSFHSNPESVTSLISKTNFPSEKLKQNLLVQNKKDSSSALHPSEKTLKNLIPADELRKAKHKSIVEYAQAHKIAITQTEKGTWTLPERPFVEIYGNTWINKRNRTQGNLIDFVAAYRNTSFLQAIAEVNQNPRLLKLEKHLSIPTRSFTSFIIPKDKQMNGKQSETLLQSLFRQKKVSFSHAEPWIHKSQLQVHKNGSIFMFPEGSHDSAIIFERDTSGTWNKSKKGNVEKPFFSQVRPGKKATIYSDPFSFLQKGINHLNHRNHTLLVMFEFNEKTLDHFLSLNPQIKDVQFKDKGIDHDIDRLQTKYKSWGITLDSPSHSRSYQGHEHTL